MVMPWTIDIVIDTTAPHLRAELSCDCCHLQMRLVGIEPLPRSDVDRLFTYECKCGSTTARTHRLN